MGGLTILRAICLGSAVYWISRAAEAALSSDGEFSSLAWAFGSLIALQVCGAFCQFLSDEFQRKFLERTETDSLRWAMQNLLLLPAGYFRKANASRFVVQIDRLLQAVRGCLNAVLTGATRVSAITGIVLGVLPIALIPVSVGVGIIGIVILISFRRSAALGEISRQRMGNEVSLIDNLLHVAASYRDHLNYGLGREALNQMQEKCEELANQSLRINTIQARIRLILKLAGVAVIVAVLGAIVWSGAAPQDALACFAALGLLLEPLSELTRVRANLMVHRFEAGELLDFFNSDLELRGEPPVISVAGGCFDPTMAGPDGEISDNFSQINALSTESVAVSFDSVPVLENISIRAVCGEILGILGPSGAGKTTLINVILGFQQPDSGILKINDRAVESVARESYWQLVYYRPQAPLRTGGSIDDEISTARPQATRSELDDAVNSMQLDTGGNKELSDHMIERARMKLRCPRVVILDEPTSLLNENQELEFCRNLRDDADDRITILVSHRPGTLTICDRLIVLKMGRIVAEGTPAQIIPLHMNCVERKAV